MDFELDPELIRFLDDQDEKYRRKRYSDEKHKTEPRQPQPSTRAEYMSRPEYMSVHQSYKDVLKNIRETLYDQFYWKCNEYMNLAQLVCFCPDDYKKWDNTLLITIKSFNAIPEGQTILTFQVVGEFIVCRYVELNGGVGTEFFNNDNLKVVYRLPQSTLQNIVKIEQHASGTKHWPGVRDGIPMCPDNFDPHRYNVLESIASVRWAHSHRQIIVREDGSSETFLDVLCRLLVNFFFDPSGRTYDRFRMFQPGQPKKYVKFENGNPAPFKV